MKGWKSSNREKLSHLVQNCTICARFMRGRIQTVEELRVSPDVTLKVAWPVGVPHDKQLRDEFARCLRDVSKFLDEATPRAAPLSVTFIPHDKDRVLPARRGAPLTPDHINGGVTAGDEIVVYRSEDACKVLVHELLHAYHWDVSFHGNPDESLVTAFDDMAPNSGEVGINEAYVEAAACCLFTLWAHGPDAIPAALSSMETLAKRLMAHHPTWPDKPMPEETHGFAYVIGWLLFWEKAYKDIMSLLNLKK